MMATTDRPDLAGAIRAPEDAPLPGWDFDADGRLQRAEGA